MFSSEFCEISKNIFFTEHIRTTTSEDEQVETQLIFTCSKSAIERHSKLTIFCAFSQCFYVDFEQVNLTGKNICLPQLLLEITSVEISNISTKSTNQFLYKQIAIPCTALSLELQKLSQRSPFVKILSQAIFTINKVQHSALRKTEENFVLNITTSCYNVKGIKLLQNIPLSKLKLLFTLFKNQSVSFQYKCVFP